MKYLQTLDTLFEGAELDLAAERKHQASIMEQINKIRHESELKIDKETKPDSAKMLEKARLIQTCAKLTSQLAQSMNKEAGLMIASAKKSSKGAVGGGESSL